MVDLLARLRNGGGSALVEALGVNPTGGAPLPPRPALERRGDFGPLGRVLSVAACDELRAVIARLRAEQLPASFVYLFDPLWVLGSHLANLVSGPHPYRLAADAWAWQIDPGKGRGWTPHRGIETPLERDAPELLNTWIALSDVEVDRACMHFVPLDGGDAVPMPLSAGEGLVWNANVLHWGGECAITARGPRVSCSFSFVRADAAARLGIPLADPPPRTVEARIDLIARQIVVYGEGQPDVRPEVLEWARANVALADLTSATRKAP